MNTIKLILLHFFLSISYLIYGQPETELDIPDNFQIEYKKLADINLDGLQDAIVILHHFSEENLDPDTVSDDYKFPPRPVLVYFGKSNGGFNLVGRNDHIRQRMNYDALGYLNGITVTRNYFTIENRYGSNVTFSNLYYTFKVVDNKVFFHRFDDEIYEVLDSDIGPELNHRKTIRANEIGYPTFSEYGK